MKKILVSACLVGCNCRYKGDNCLNKDVVALSDEFILIPVCPEQLGGLHTPRLPGEILNGKVWSSAGDDVTPQYSLGASLALEIAKRNAVSACVLKANSPSCGKGMIYDGTFSGKKITGNGVAAQTLLDAGYPVFTENEVDELKLKVKD